VGDEEALAGLRLRAVPVERHRRPHPAFSVLLAVDRREERLSLEKA
jgi:hypothetical protein